VRALCTWWCYGIWQQSRHHLCRGKHVGWLRWARCCPGPLQGNRHPGLATFQSHQQHFPAWSRHVLGLATPSPPRWPLLLPAAAAATGSTSLSCFQPAMLTQPTGTKPLPLNI
jgi:hypothetical protein